MKKNHTIRWAFLLLAVSMLLCACAPQVSGTVTPNTDPTASDPVMSLGRIEGGVYTNTYVGFTMRLGSDWSYYSAEELQELPDNVADMFEGSEIGEAMNSIQQFTDVMAENVNDMTTINLLYQKLDLQSRLMYASMTEEAIIDSVLDQSDMLINSYAQAGIIVEKLEKVTVTFLGEQHTAIKTTASTSGVAYYILQLYDYHLGQYSATITFGSFVEDKTESLLSLCQKIR